MAPLKRFECLELLERLRERLDNLTSWVTCCVLRCVTMKPKTLRKAAHKTIRRSVALPRQLINEASAVAPPELRHNLNRLVTVALQEYAVKRRERDFKQAMAQMVADPAIQAECAVITKDFTVADTDGLKHD